MTEKKPNDQRKAIADHDAVNEWLLSLQANDADEFERVRKLPFSDQKKLAGVA